MKSPFLEYQILKFLLSNRSNLSLALSLTSPPLKKKVFFCVTSVTSVTFWQLFQGSKSINPATVEHFSPLKPLLVSPVISIFPSLSVTVPSLFRHFLVFAVTFFVNFWIQRDGDF